PPLHSRSFGDKCQTVHDGDTGVRCLQVLIVRVRVPEPHATSVRMLSSSGLTEELAKTMQIISRLRVFPIALFTVTIPMVVQMSQAQDRSQGRSMVISRNGIVAAEAPRGAQAGARILERGGNAVAAAIAANAMMGVVEPMMNGIGGDLFAIVYDAKGNKLY